MKRYYRYLTIAALAAIVAGCMEFLAVNHPATAPVNTGVDATFDVKIEVNKDIDIRTTPVVAILAPTAWKMAENAVVTYTTSDGSGTKEMRLAVGTDKEPKTGGPWSAALKSRIGLKSNYEPVEWVAFIATTDHNWGPNDQFTGTITVRFTTGSENLKTNLAYFIGNTQDGVHDDAQYYLLHEQPFETTGGSNATIDYTLPKMCSISPEAFTWEDIVAIKYDATIQVDGVDSPLKGADKIYLMARASYNGETQEAVVDAVGAKTLMTKNGKDKWMLYIYPHEFFGVPAGVKIDKVSFYMVNADKSIEVKMPDGEEFSFPENDK